MTVTIRVPHKRLGSVLRKVPGAVFRQVVEAMHDTADYGKTAVQSVINRTKPKPVATNTYRSAWTVTKGRKGAVLGNSTLQSYFVEVGRRPGRAPPIEPLMEWLKVKRDLRKRPKRKRGPSKAKKTEKKQSKKKRLSSKPRKESRTTIACRRSLAFKISRKIAKFGTRARFPLKRTIPRMQRFLARSIRKKVKDTKPPR